jgi:hypothetical protein
VITFAARGWRTGRLIALALLVTSVAFKGPSFRSQLVVVPIEIDVETAPRCIRFSVILDLVPQKKRP